MKTNINTQALQRALASFKQVLKRDAKNDKELQDILRDSLIQRFEYTYELSWKLAQRVLIEQYGAINIIEKPKRDLFREAKQRGLIDNIQSWFTYHSARNSTSAIYNENVADDVLSDIADFDSQVEFLLNKINDLIS